jgi:hypothetical protein
MWLMGRLRIKMRGIGEPGDGDWRYRITTLTITGPWDAEKFRSARDTEAIGPCTRLNSSSSCRTLKAGGGGGGEEAHVEREQGRLKESRSELRK